MDLIGAHRDGLAEQLAAEAHGLAGRARDHGQRAIVYHHLFDHSGGRHGYALLSAEGALALAPAIARMRAAARRSQWRYGREAAAQLAERVEAFGDALAEIDRQRCEAMVVAYRAAQHAATSALVPRELVALGDGSDPAALFFAHQRFVEARWGMAIEGALEALAWPLRPEPVRAALAVARIEADRFERLAGKGLRKRAQAVLADRRLPAGFAANPAQHYYALQRAMAAKRRSERAALDGVPIEETVRLDVAA